MEVSGQLHTPASLLRGKYPQYPFDRWLTGSQNRSESVGEEKKNTRILLKQILLKSLVKL
jgi:hypothetical protein